MAYDAMYARGFDDSNDDLAGLTDIFNKVAGVATAIAGGAATAGQVYSGGANLYVQPYVPPRATPEPTNYTTPLLLGAAGLLGVVLFMMRRGRR